MYIFVEKKLDFRFIRRYVYMYIFIINWLKVLNSKYYGDVYKFLILNIVVF